MSDRVSGPIPREKFRELAALPFGEAKRQIQQHDPLWGISPGEKVEFMVEVRGERSGHAYVKAASEDEALRLADKLTGDEVDWYGDDLEVLAVTPLPPRKKSQP